MIGASDEAITPQSAVPEPSVEQRSRLGGSGHHTVGLRQLGVVALQMLGRAGSGRMAINTWA